MPIVKEIHGVPVWLLREYLIELGASLDDDHHAHSQNWSAYFYRTDDFRIGSIVVGRLHLEIDGEEQALATLEPQLDLKLTRGGG
jgi:hypothetical protein